MSAFDKISTKTTTAKSKSTKPTAEVNPATAVQVDQYVANKGELARLEAEQLDLATAIVAVVQPQQDKLALTGNFTKSLDVPGMSSKVVYVTSDRFSVPQDDETLAEIRKLVGKKYDEFFETKATISLKANVTKDEKLLNKIASACEKAGLDIGTIFDKVDKVVAKDDLDLHQYDLPTEKLPIFRALVKQSKPALK
jgi:hypothetical protein